MPTLYRFQSCLTRCLLAVFVTLCCLGNPTISRGAVDIRATFDSASASSIAHWSSANIPNPGAETKRESFSLKERGPLGKHFARFLLDNGYKIGQSAGERVSVTGLWGSGGTTSFDDAVPGKEYWYIEAFRIPSGFSFGPRFTILSEWHSNASNASKPLYPQAPWKFRVMPRGEELWFNVKVNTGLQFGNNATAWEIDGWNPAWGPTTPSASLREPTTNTKGSRSPDGNPFWLAPVSFDKWHYFLYRIKWSNDWDGLFECWTRTEDDESWEQVANYRSFPTHVYQPGDPNAHHYAQGMYYRGDGGIRQSLDYGGRARSDSVADAERGSLSTGFAELAALARLGNPSDPVGAGSDGEGPGAGASASQRVVRISGARIPHRGRLVVRLRGIRGARVTVAVRGPRGMRLARVERTIRAQPRVRYRLRLHRYRTQSVLNVRIRARVDLRRTEARMRLRLSRHGHRIVRSTIRHYS